MEVCGLPALLQTLIKLVAHPQCVFENEILKNFHTENHGAATTFSIYYNILVVLLRHSQSGKNLSRSTTDTFSPSIGCLEGLNAAGRLSFLLSLTYKYI